MSTFPGLSQPSMPPRWKPAFFPSAASARGRSGATFTRSPTAIADNGFIHVQARIGVGRTPEVRQKAAEHIFAALKAETAKVFAKRPLGLTFEIVEIDPVGSLKHNNLHEIVEARRKGSAA